MIFVISWAMNDKMDATVDDFATEICYKIFVSVYKYTSYRSVCHVLNLILIKIAVNFIFQYINANYWQHWNIGWYNIPVSFKLHWRLFLYRGPTENMTSFVRWWVGAENATRRHLNQTLPRSRTRYGVNRLQWINEINEYIFCMFIFIPYLKVTQKTT